MSVTGFKKKIDMGMGGWGEHFGDFWKLFNLAKPLVNMKQTCKRFE